MNSNEVIYIPDTQVKHKTKLFDKSSIFTLGTACAIATVSVFVYNKFTDSDLTAVVLETKPSHGASTTTYVLDEISNHGADEADKKLLDIQQLLNKSYQADFEVKRDQYIESRDPEAWHKISDTSSDVNEKGTGDSQSEHQS